MIVTPVIETKERPLTLCPKCGSDVGWSGPFYRRGHPGLWSDSIEFVCRTCGFSHSQTPLDRKQL